MLKTFFKKYYTDYYTLYYIGKKLMPIAWKSISFREK